MLRWAAVTAVSLLLTACGSVSSSVSSEDRASPGPAGDPPTPSARTAETPAPVLMPDLLGLPSAEAARRLGELEMSARLGLGFTWERPVVVRCGARPRTVVRQRPAPGTPLERGAEVQIRTAALDLEEFRGPCEPPEGDLGPVAGPDAALAREFYRFAADPSLGAPFAHGDVWVGIEDGLTSVSVGQAERGELAAWEVGSTYAEGMGPFSALDILASSGGYYEVRHGVTGTCPSGNDEVPAAMAGLRAISLTAPSDVVGACMEWWGVTLFLDAQDRIRGVALRLGSP